MISLSDALAALRANALPAREPNALPLLDAVGGVLADDVRARLTLPPFAASVMDGYAVRLSDVRSPGARLDVVGESAAGGAYAGTLRPGEAVRIFTGAPVPAGADHVVMQEDTERQTDTVVIKPAFETPHFIRPIGMDFGDGAVILSAGTRVGPGDVALAAAANHATLPVARPARIAVLAAGSELVPAGAARAPGDIVDSNSPALEALFRLWGARAASATLVRDDPGAIRAEFEAALGPDAAADIILPVGGASVGDHDHMRRVFADLGGEMVFERVAVRPGKPSWFGRLRGTPVLGLPGNPASAIVCAHLFLRPLLGLAAAPVIQARTLEPLPANGPRETYLRARAGVRDGGLVVRPFPKQSSALIRPLAEANVLLRRLPGADALAAGGLAEIVALGTGPDAMAPLD